MRLPTAVMLIQLNAQRQLNFKISFIKPLESNNQTATHTHIHTHTGTQCKADSKDGESGLSDWEALTLKAAAVS